MRLINVEQSFEEAKDSLESLVDFINNGKTLSKKELLVIVENIDKAICSLEATVHLLSHVNKHSLQDALSDYTNCVRKNHE